MKNRSSQILFNYWNEVRAGRLAPRRFDVEPARISPILADTLLLELSDTDNYRFRLAGTRICEQFTTELRGASFLELWEEPARDRLSEALRQVADLGSVATITFDAISIDGRAAEFEAIVLPLIHSKETIDRFLGAISCAEPPAWLGHEPIAKLELTECQTLWPDGKPYSVIASLGRQAPFRPAFSEGRIVRSDRRQFRVLDGGRSDRGADEG